MSAPEDNPYAAPKVMSRATRQRRGSDTLIAAVGAGCATFVIVFISLAALLIAARLGYLPRLKGFPPALAVICIGTILALVAGIGAAWREERRVRREAEPKVEQQP